jgi:hypothetical protein
MAAVSTSRRALAGVFFIVGGALLLLELILSLAKVASLPWLVALALLAIAIAFAVLAIGAVNSTLAKITLWAAAVGWLLLAIDALKLVNLPGVLITLAALVAGVGGLIAAIVLYVGKEIRNTPAILFIATTVLGLLYLLPAIGVSGLGSLGTVIAVLFGIGLVVTGYLFTRKEGRR